MVTKRVVLHFPKQILDQPIVYKLIKDYDLIMNILQARITPEQEARMIMELTGTAENYDKGMAYLKQFEVSIQLLSKDIRRNDDRCTQCGACVTICPTNAMQVERPAMNIVFDDTKCVACEGCVRICPFHAMEVLF